MEPKDILTMSPSASRSHAITEYTPVAEEVITRAENEGGYTIGVADTAQVRVTNADNNAAMRTKTGACWVPPPWP